MNGFRIPRNKKLCYKKIEDLDKSQYRTVWTDDGTGGRVKVTYFIDGTSITHWGGRAGDACYDEFGEEC